MSDLAPLSFTRLSIEDRNEILALLTSTWPVLYGKTGCPVFTETYIDWLYGGAAAPKHTLIGCRLGDGKLVGFKGYLHRSVEIGGDRYDAGIATHLAIDPNVPLGLRLGISSELSQFHSLQEEPNTLNIAYFEADKRLARSVRNNARRAGIHVSEMSFQQYVVNPRRLKAAAPETDCATIRPATVNDATVLAEMKVPQNKTDQLDWTPDTDALWHHLSAAPSAFCLIAERDGQPVGAFGGYVLDWIKDGQTSSMFICEHLKADRPEVLNQLLRCATDHANSIGLRGIVLENASWLEDEFLSAGGLLKTPRQMTMSIRSTQPLKHPLNRFTCDIK